MRIQGIADISDVRYAILEQNGKISFIKESDSPNLATTVVIDTKSDIKNITAAGYNIEWLNKKLKENNVSLSEIFLMTVDENGEINIIKKENKK